MRWYNEIYAFIQHSMPNLRATQRVNLALLTAAVLSRRKLSLSALARAMIHAVNSASHHQSKKRLFRFLSNHHFDPIRVQTP